MVEKTPKRELTDEDILRAVRWRFRICNYLFKLAAVWIFVGALGYGLASRLPADDDAWRVFREVVYVVGFAIISVAVALTLAIYRCPVCDRYLSRFRPRKGYCPSCGAKVRAST